MISEKIIVICGKDQIFFPIRRHLHCLHTTAHARDTDKLWITTFHCGDSARSMCEVCVMRDIRICKRPMPVTASRHKKQYYEEIVDYIWKSLLLLKSTDVFCMHSECWHMLQHNFDRSVRGPDLEGLVRALTKCKVKFLFCLGVEPVSLRRHSFWD